MSRISFGKTAYVSGTSSDILDAIERECSPAMTGDGLVCIDWDELPAEDPGDLTQASMLEVYLWQVHQEIVEHGGGDGIIGDVIFAK